MFAVVASFVASALYSHSRLSSAAEALSIATNAAPSIRYVADARMHLHRLALPLSYEVAAADSPTVAASIANERRLLDDNLSSYYKLPVYAGERDLQRALKAPLDKLDAGLASVRERLAAGEKASARTVVFEQIGGVLDELDDRLRQLVELNGGHLEADATEIQRKQRRYNKMIFVLYGVSILIAALATLLVISAVRRYFSVLDRRARELEFFAIQVGHDILNPLTAVLAGLRIARDQASGDSLRQTLDRSLRGVDRIQEQLAGLRSFAASAAERSSSGTPASVKACLEGAVAALAHAGARIVCESAEDVWVDCPNEILERIVRALLADAVTRSGSDTVRVRVVASARRVHVEIEGGPVPARGVDLFSARVRGPDSGYPGIDLAMLGARRLTEAYGGVVGTRAAGDDCVTFLELPRA